MLARLSPFRIADRRDVLLFTVATVLVIGFSTVWSVILAPLLFGGDQVLNKYLMAVVVLGGAAAVATIPLLLPGWGRAGGKPIAGWMVRFGLALQIFSVLLSPLALLYATDPTRSVPLGFAAFTGMLIGVFVAGFGGNMLAPSRA